MIYNNADENYIDTLIVHDRNYFRPVLNFLEKYADKNSKILDVGTGTGNLIKILREEGYSNSFGIDLDERFIKSGRENFGLDCIYTLKDCPFEKNHFDIVISYTVAEHIDDLEEFINFKLSFLKDNGFFYLYTPNYHCPNYYFHIIKSKLKGKKLHLTPFTEGNLFKSLNMYMKILYYSYYKLLFKKTKILKVKPIPADLSVGGDADAVWCSNYLDIHNYFCSRKDLKFEELEKPDSIKSIFSRSEFIMHV